MDCEGGGVATATTPRRLTSQHSTLRETFLASDLAESLNNPDIINDNNINDDNYNSLVNPRPISSLTLGAVLNNTKKSPPANNAMVRTLLEIIRNDETLNVNGGSSTTTNSYFGGKKSWKSFKDRLKLKRTSVSQNQNPNSNQWVPSLPVPQSDILPNSRNPSDELSLRESTVRIGGRSSFRLSAALEAEREETHQRFPTEVSVSDVNDSEDSGNVESRNNGSYGEEEGVEQPGLIGSGNQPVRMSLMDLLEETEYQSRGRGPTYRFDEMNECEEEVEREEEEKDGKKEHSCCVCMVRHKGAAFIPCGHTFCRKCSRELWVQRGNCPLCNNFILEILDIF